MKNTRIFFSLFTVLLLSLTMMNQVVSASVVEVEKILYIESNDLINYTAELNIVNDSNIQYTNFEQLVKPFMVQSGIYGGFSGSFLPPSKFSLNKPALGNDHLILTSFVEFNRKNLLSGASSSWWRSPYYYNYLFGHALDWNLNMSIYHVDMPRNVNLSFEKATPGNNYPVVPTNSAHPSLIFQKTFTNCGNIQNNEQWYTHESMTIPINDTLENPELPYNETDNPHKYMTTMNYGHTWFNVSAPIYPNSSYMIIWDIDSSFTGIDSGSFWITSSDIGNNGYGRSLVSFNDRTVYDIPVDLDTSVIFQIGMGAGVTGSKLKYENNILYESHAGIDNPNFEDKERYYGRNWDSGLTSFSTWEESANQGYVIHNADTSSADFYIEDDNGKIGMSCLIWNSKYGDKIKIDMSMHEYEYIESGGNKVFISNFGIFTSDSNYKHLDLEISKRSVIFADGSPTVYDNIIRYTNSVGTPIILQLPETLPVDMYITIENNINPFTGFGFNYLIMYDKAISQVPFYTTSFSLETVTTSSSWNMTFTSRLDTDNGINLGAVDLSPATTPFTPSLLVRMHDFSIIERLSHADGKIDGWTITESLPAFGISKTEWFEGFESNAPEYIPTTSTTSVSFYPTDIFANDHQITQTFPTSVSLVNKRYYFSGFYRLVPDKERAGEDNSYVEYKIIGDGSASAIKRGYAWDTSWHEICVELVGSFTQIEIQITAHFGIAPSNSIRQIHIDNIDVESISIEDADYHRFYQEVDTSEWDSTTFVSFMFPIKMTQEPDFPPICDLEFIDVNTDISIYTYHTTPIDYRNDFILTSIKTSNIGTSGDAIYVKIHLYNFCDGAYIFLQDRNSDYNLNSKHTYKYNHFETFQGIADIRLDETFFSPYYSLSTTSGEWGNSDSTFTTTFFYYVTVYFVEFNDNDPEIISIEFSEVGADGFEVYKFKLKSFGDVYTAKEWLAYLEIRNRPEYKDSVSDVLIYLTKWMLENTVIGQIVMAIGKFIFKVLEYITPYIEDAMNLLLKVIVLVISIVVYFLSVWIMWKFVKFWILLGEGKTEEAIAEFQSVTSAVSGVVAGAVPYVGSSLSSLSKIGRKKK